MRQYTPIVNSEWLPGYKLVISCPGVLPQRNTMLMTWGFALGRSALYFCCSSPGQDITKTCKHTQYIVMFPHSSTCKSMRILMYVSSLFSYTLLYKNTKKDSLDSYPPVSIIKVNIYCAVLYYKISLIRHSMRLQKCACLGGCRIME